MFQSLSATHKMKLHIFLLSILHFYYLVYGEIPNLQNVEIPDIDDFAVIKEKCDKLGGNGTYDKLKEAKDALQGCLQGFVDFTVLKNEVEESKKTGSMDEVFGKYCAKRPKVTSCVQNFTSVLRPCLNDEESKALNTTLDILQQLGEFVCFRDGDRIAMFVAEGGVECIKDHVEGIKNCVNSTFKITPTVNTNSLPNLLMDKKKCDDLGKLQSCVVEELEKCSESTPANIVDALFRFIKRSACSNKNKRSIHNIIRRSVAFTSNLYNVTEMKGKLLKNFEKKCNENYPDRGFENFQEAFNNTTECTTRIGKTDPILVTPSDKFKENMKNCAKDLIEATKNCLPEEEKYWPEFQMKILWNIIDFAYKNKDKMRLQSSRTELFNCFQNFKQSDGKNEMIKCVKDSEAIDFKKEVVCKRLESVKACVSEQLKKRCIREITISKLNDELFDAFLEPCNEN